MNESGRWSALGLANLVGGVIAGLLTTAVLAALGAAPVLIVAALIVLVSGWVILTRGARRHQRAIADVLTEPSSSTSAKRALELVQSLLMAGASAARVTDTILTITSFRRFPHEPLLEVISERLAAGEPGDELDQLTEIIRREMDIARTRVRRELGTFITSLPASSILVLYGYSTTVCDALTRVAARVHNPIWVVEDKQYADASIGEHQWVRQHLRKVKLDHHLLTFADFLRCAGNERVDSIETADGKTIVVPRTVGLVGLIGCDVSDDTGTFLIPGVSRGQPSETLKFVEQFAPTDSGVDRQLVVATESYKMVESLNDRATSTCAPLQTPWYLKALNLAGLAIPFLGRTVQLLPVRSVGAVVTDRATIRAPLQAEQLRGVRERWHARLDSDLARLPLSTRTPEPIQMVAQLQEIFGVLEQLPPLVEAGRVPAEKVDSALRAQCTQLLAQCFPEVDWSDEAVETRVFTPGEFEDLFVISAQSELVAMVTLHSTADPQLGKLHWMAVAERFRRKNFALSLIRALADAADQKGYTRIYLATESDKTAAIHLYTRVAFRPWSSEDELGQ